MKVGRIVILIHELKCSMKCFHYVRNYYLQCMPMLIETKDDIIIQVCKNHVKIIIFPEIAI